jgi:hypothetical protein
MKKLFLTVFYLIFFQKLFSQYQPVESNRPAERVPVIYFSGGGGINNRGIVSVGAEVKIIKNLTVNGSAGLGLWGSKLTCGLRYYKNYPKGIYYSASYGVATGIDSFNIQLTTTTSTKPQKVLLELNEARNINLAIGYIWKINRKFKLNFEAGYAFPLNLTTYEVLTPDIELDDSSKRYMEMLSPGGILLGFGISIGI